MTIVNWDGKHETVKLNINIMSKYLWNTNVDYLQEIYFVSIFLRRVKCVT